MYIPLVKAKEVLFGVNAKIAVSETGPYPGLMLMSQQSRMDFVSMFRYLFEETQAFGLLPIVNGCSPQQLLL